MKLTEQQYLDELRKALCKVLIESIDPDEIHDAAGAQRLVDLAIDTPTMSIQDVIHVLQDQAWDIESALHFMVQAAIKTEIDIDAGGMWST